MTTISGRTYQCMASARHPLDSEPRPAAVCRVFRAWPRVGETPAEYFRRRAQHELGAGGRLYAYAPETYSFRGETPLGVTVEGRFEVAPRSAADLMKDPSRITRDQIQAGDLVQRWTPVFMAGPDGRLTVPTGEYSLFTENRAVRNDHDLCGRWTNERGRLVHADHSDDSPHLFPPDILIRVPS
jgi:transglutaminase-like putative cysteine protease